MGRVDERYGDIVLFDGVCNLCNWSVEFVLKRDPKGIFRFASIQSPAGRQVLQQLGLPPEFARSVVYVGHGRAYLESEAALKIARKLRPPWPLIALIGLLIPAPVRDRIYAAISRHRYQWFGRRHICMVPDAEQLPRFLR